MQSSLRQQFGLGGDQRNIPPPERGIAEMMVNLYALLPRRSRTMTMFEWHKMVMSGKGASK